MSALDGAFYVGEIVRLPLRRKGRIVAFTDSRYGTIATVAVGRRGTLCAFLGAQLRKA